jgi:flagellar protein FliO/FliZ
MELLAGSQIIRLVAALLLVVGLMLGLNLFMRRIQGGTLARTGAQRRLQIVEIMPLDARRRIALIRRDDREHLVILSGTGETVVETGIIPPGDKETMNA